MKELSKTNRLTIIIVAIVLVFIMGILTIRKPEIKYSHSPAQSLELLNDTANIITVEDAKAILTLNNGKTVFIDVRNSIAYERNHIKDARNIPVRELFSKSNLAYLRELDKGDQTAVLYGETVQQANGPWMMLLQTGFKNIMLLNSSFNQFSSAGNDSLNGKLSLQNEIPLIDTVALKKLTASVVSDNQLPAKIKPAKKIVLPVKTEPTSGGGC